MSKMFRLKFNLCQSFMCILLLWPAIIYSFPTTEVSHRYQRDASETVVFSEGEELDLVLQSGNNLLFETCCNKEGGCNAGSFQFCFQTTQVIQTPTGLSGCGAGTCSYKVTFQPNGRRDFSMGWFNTTDSCFKGKIDDVNIYAISATDGVLETKTSPGCPLDRQPGNRLRLHVKDIPDGVTVKALNAQKYVEPTTLPPTTAPPPTTEPTNATKEAPSPATKEETEMSDALKFSLIGVGIFVFILIAGGIGFAVYWFCFKKKKSPKPALPVPAAKTDTAAAKQTSTAPPIMPFEVKPKEAKKVEKETKDVKDSKLAPSDVVLPSSAAPPPPPTESKEPTASKEPSAVPSKLELQKSSLPGPSLEPSSVINPPVKVRQSQPPELPPATPTVADLIGRVGRRYRVGGRKYFDTFDRIQVPHFEGIFESMIRIGWITEDQALKVKKEKFIRPPSEEEIKLFAAPISVMYQLLEEMINDAVYSHNKTQHDGDAQCTLVENEFHTYFVSLYAVVAHFAKYFKIGKEVPLEKCSVPLLLGIAMDRSQSESLRRRALVIMTIKAVDLTKIFPEAQCIKLPYPMCVICLSYQLDRYLVDNVYRLHTYSSPNNSECTKSDQQKTGGVKSGAADKSRRADGEKQSSSSSSKLGTKTSVSKEVVVSAAQHAAVEKKKKMKKKGKKH